MTLKQLVGADTAKLLTMTARKVSGKEAHDLGLVTELAADPVAAAHDLARELAERSPDALAAAKRLFDDTWTASVRRTFARERAEQLLLLFGANAKRRPRGGVRLGPRPVRSPHPTLRRRV